MKDPSDRLDTEMDERPTSQRALDGAILFNKFLTTVAGASDVLGPLKVACDILGFMLDTTKVSTTHNAQRTNIG